MKVSFYVSGTRRVPVQEFISDQNVRVRAAIADAVQAIYEEGLETSGVVFRQIQGKLWELKIRAGVAVRIFYFVQTKVRQEPQMVLLHGYIKKTHKAPTDEVEVALQRMKEVGL